MNMTSARFFVMLMVVGLVSGQVPQTCNPPSQISFRATHYDHEFVTFNRYNGVYDATNQRIAFMEDMTRSMPGKQFFHLIFLYSQNTAYEINVTTKKCVRGTTGKFTGWGIPANATFEELYSFGGAQDNLEAMEWSDRLPTRRANWISYYTRKLCYPITTVLYSTENVDRSVTTNAYNIVEGLSQPELFIPPESCQEGSVVYGSLGDATRNLVRIFTR